MDMNEEQHIRQFIQGDADALYALVEEYRKPLFGFIISMTEGCDDADEIFQEVWIKAMHALPRYKHQQRFSSWLFKIAHRRIIDRSRKQRPAFSLDKVHDTIDLPGTTTHTTADNVISDQELGHQIRAAVSALPTQQREVFTLRMETDLSFKEIAKIQNTSINTVLARMSYALQKLRELLGPTYRELT